MAKNEVFEGMETLLTQSKLNIVVTHLFIESSGSLKLKKVISLTLILINTHISYNWWLGSVLTTEDQGAKC